MEQMIFELMGLLGARSTSPPTHPYGDAAAPPPPTNVEIPSSPRPHVDVENVPPTHGVDVNAFIQDIVTPTHVEIGPSPQSHVDAATATCSTNNNMNEEINMRGECASSYYCDKCVWSEMEYFMTNSQPSSCVVDDSPSSPINYPPASPPSSSPEVYYISDEDEDDPEQNAQNFFKRKRITLC
nr:uncharacterized protein LOC128693847 [Cherax quadricarinatus]